MFSDRTGEHPDDLTLSRFADGELKGRVARRVHSHLRSCAACREKVQFIRDLGHAIQTIPSPKPPDELFNEIFGHQSSRAEVGSVPSRPRQLFPRWVSMLGSGLTLTVALLLVSGGPEPVFAGSSTLSLQPTETGDITIRYETAPPLAAERRLRARIRYWLPDSLRFVQTAPGFTAIELAREDAGRFKAVATLPANTVYAVAAVENIAGTHIDSNYGRFWEYMDMDSHGKPTLQARRYQLIATPELNVASTAQVAERAASAFPDQPEFWLWHLSFELDGLSPVSIDTVLSTHAARLATLDHTAREGNPGPVEIDALSRYARLLGATELATYWSAQLVARHPRHGLAALANLERIVGSARSNAEILEALEKSWAITEAPLTARFALEHSMDFADPALTQRWLDRHSASSAFRNLTDDTEVARDMMEVPALWPLAERWILDRLSRSVAWVGPARRLDQSRHNFEATTRQDRGRLHVYLSRIRLGRGDLEGAIDAVEQSIGATWNPRVFVEAAELYRVAGSETRATDLIALARVDPVTTVEPYFPVVDDARWRTPSTTQLAAAQALLREGVLAELVEERIDFSARLQAETGEEISLREVVGGDPGVTLVVQTIRRDFIPDGVFALLELNEDRLASAGVRALFVTQQTDSSPVADPRADVPFYRDTKQEVWGTLRAWRNVQYFVIDPEGNLRHRGEDPEAALRIALVLST